MENLKQATGEIKAKVQPQNLLVSYNSYEIVRAAVLPKKLFGNRFSYIQTLLFRTRLPLTRQYGFQNRNKVYMSSIQFCSRKSLSFPFLGITSPSVFDTGCKSSELTGYRTNLGLTSANIRYSHEGRTDSKDVLFCSYICLKELLAFAINCFRWHKTFFVLSSSL